MKIKLSELKALIREELSALSEADFKVPPHSRAVSHGLEGGPEATRDPRVRGHWPPAEQGAGHKWWWEEGGPGKDFYQNKFHNYDDLHSALDYAVKQAKQILDLEKGAAAPEQDEINSLNQIISTLHKLRDVEVDPLMRGVEEMALREKEASLHKGDTE